MANIGGPRPAKRRLLITSVESVLLYGAEIWAGALRFEKYRRRLAAVQRRCALRVASSYRTVAEPAVLVIAGMLPIDLLAHERKQVYEAKRSGQDTVDAKRVAREATLHRWQQRWMEEARGRWTASLIPSLAPWLNRKHGEVDYYLTQFLSGHGYFRAYLFRMGKATPPMCGYGCQDAGDSAEHTLFRCGRWAAERNALQQEVGPITPDNIVGVMLQTLQTWSAVANYVRRLLQRKKKEESRWNPLNTV
ncbi:uncharacterized protein LOC123989125 [Osmia bicornis bicornis]|uniref:uncharacterized protein LOC123989125 n=1 Tax=Osmia bicornis bicornis TaxID=1437191 RepID=UPI001EAEF56D|nr:uncharacterized protein LOC123989125 [Osmia bicornis bicornis]